MSDRKQYHRDYYWTHRDHLRQIKAERQKHDLDYRLCAILRTIVQRCEDPRHTSYKWYGGRNIKNFLTLDDLKFLWERDGAEKMHKPSIDRNHRDDNYELSRCKFIEHADNARKGVAYRVSQRYRYSKAPCPGCGKMISSGGGSAWSQHQKRCNRTSSHHAPTSTAEEATR